MGSIQIPVFSSSLFTELGFLYLSQMYIMHGRRIFPGQYLGRNKNEAAYDIVSATLTYCSKWAHPRKIHEHLLFFFLYPHTSLKCTGNLR